MMYQATFQLFWSWLSIQVCHSTFEQPYSWFNWYYQVKVTTPVKTVFWTTPLPGSRSSHCLRVRQKKRDSIFIISLLLFKHACDCAWLHFVGSIWLWALTGGQHRNRFCSGYLSWWSDHIAIFVSFAFEILPQRVLLKERIFANGAMVSVCI